MRLKEPAIMEKYNKKELGDYQTPIYFTETVCDYLKNDLKISPDIIIDPTCGIGNFLKTSSEFFPGKEIWGIDIDKDKLDEVDRTIPNLKLINDDIFTFRFDDFDKSRSFLIIGNPPWITNTELSKINSNNVPAKSNYRNEMAIDAMMGDSNFDISESITLKMIDEFRNSDATIAFLCKTVVSRNVFRELIRKEIAYSFIKQLNFNSSKVFKIDADACLFIIGFGGEPLTDKTCKVADLSDPSQISCRFGYVSGNFYSNIDDIPDIDGECPFEWRQGVKHDCSSVMELTCKNGRLINKNNEEVSIENTLIYPLLKSSNLKVPIVKTSSKYIIITQQRIKQDTDYIKTEAPKTWEYLNRNRSILTREKVQFTQNPQISAFSLSETILSKRIR
jgi:16S rRNA A1518/A1519 N6-dimethyltransferase RsmA/KsgA/DIM1 with predicted DNA glycosylase/AP lyase activity